MADGAHGEREVGVVVVVGRGVRPCDPSGTEKPRQDDRHSTHESQHDEQRAHRGVLARAIDRGQGRGCCCAVLIARSCSISYVVVVQLWLWNSGDGTRLPSLPAISDELECGMAAPSCPSVARLFRFMDMMTTGTARRIRRASSGTHGLVGKSPPTRAAGLAGCVGDVTDREA